MIPCNTLRSKPRDITSGDYHRLRTQVAGFLLRPVLAESETLRNLDEAAIDMLASRMQLRHVSPGHDICQGGDPADRLWILQDGAHCCCGVHGLLHSAATHAS